MLKLEEIRKKETLYHILLAIQNGKVNLELCGYGINDNGLEIICEELKNNTTVKYLGLNNNYCITDIGAQHIISMLECNNAINDICLDGLYNVSPNLVKEIGKLLKTENRGAMDIDDDEHKLKLR